MPQAQAPVRRASPVRGGFSVVAGAATGFAYYPILPAQTLEGVELGVDSGRAQAQVSLCDDNVSGTVFFGLDEGVVCSDGTSVPRKLEWEGSWTNDGLKSVWVKFFAFNVTGNTAIHLSFSVWVVA